MRQRDGKVVGPVPGLRRLEHADRGPGTDQVRQGRLRGLETQQRQAQAALGAGHAGGDKVHHRCRRAGPRARRRSRPRLRGARRRRAGRRQVHAALAALRPGREDRARALCHRRGEPPPAQDARPAPRRLGGRDSTSSQRPSSRR